MEIRNKTALITGGARRIGREIALGLAKEGVNVLLHYNTSEEDAIKTCDEIRSHGVDCWLIRGDLSQDYSTIIEKGFNIVREIDFLINNASIFPLKKFEEVTVNDLNNTVLLNSWVPLFLTKKFISHTKSGKIINVLDSIISGYNFERYAYYLSKKMLEVITLSLALKLAPNFTVNAIAPGIILPPEGKDYSYLEALKDVVPLKKYGSVGEIVSAVIFLLRSDFITGQIIYVDGGEHLKPRVIL